MRALMGLSVGVVLGLVMMTTTMARADEITVPATARTMLQITAYDGGVAFIRERRTVEVPAGTTDVALEGVAPRLVPASVIISSDDARIHGVRYDFAVLSPETLLQKFVGKEVGVIRTNSKTGEETRERAMVLTTTGGLVLQFADRIETGQPGRLVFDAIPSGLRLRPTLLANVEAATAGRRQIELSYLAGGVDWSADYALTFDPARDRLAIGGRAILSNRSGIDFVDASVGLIAGEINRAAPPPMPRAAKADMALAAAPAAAPPREAIGDAHLYTLPQPITLANDESRQIPLFAAAEVPAKVVYVSTASVYPASSQEGIEQSHPKVQISFVNGPTEGQNAQGPGVPLPAGTARIYIADTSGTPRLIGEDRINHTPVGERVELEPGTAFDITIARKQTAFTRLDVNQNLYESAYAISVKNAKDRDASVRLVEVLPGDWQILAETAPHEKESANRVVWLLTVPAAGEMKLTYKVRVRL